MIKSAASATPLYLAIDQGGHASRAFIFNTAGVMLSRGTSTIEAKTSANGHVEYSAKALLSSIHSAIQTAISVPEVEVTEIIAAGIATQRANIACWDKLTGKPLAPIISWQDRRASHWIRNFHPHEKEVHQASGLFLSPHYGVGKLKWCFENLPSVIEAYQKKRLCWGPMSSFLLYQLLDGNPYLVDPVNASRTLLWNIKNLDWDPSLITLFELPDNPLPSCVPNQHPFGTITIAGHTIPMAIVIGDQSASLFAWQQLQHDALYINIGTGAFIQRVTDSDCVITPHLLTSLLLQKNNKPYYALEGTVNGAGSALSWIEQQLKPKNLYQQLPQWLDENDNKMLFLNGIAGLGSPYWQPDFNSRFLGEGDDKQKIVAIIESVAFLLQCNIEQLQIERPSATKILISGGLAQLNGLCQRIADLSGLMVHRMAECEATASGLAWLLREAQAESMASSNHWKKHEVELISPQRNEKLTARYRRWQLAMAQALN